MCTVGPEYDVFRLYFLFSEENKVRSVFSENAGDTAQTFIPHLALMTSQARHNGRFGQWNARDIPSGSSCGGMVSAPPPCYF
ncbi:hypothetical protein ACU9CR_003346 [Cronobacter dublinensis]